MLRTLFLQAPSFDGFDGGAGSRYQAKREIKSFWYPTWLAQPAALVEGSRLIDAPPHRQSLGDILPLARAYDLVVLHTSTPSFASDVKTIEAMKSLNPDLKAGMIGAKVAVDAEGSLRAAPEVDFVARNEDFKAFAYQVALHVAATAPRYVSSEEIPAQEREAEQRVFEEKAREEGKPDNVVEKIVSGQLSKWASEVALLDQSHVNAEKHDSKTIEELRQELAAKTGENVRIARFTYFHVGEE